MTDGQWGCKVVQTTPDPSSLGFAALLSKELRRGKDYSSICESEWTNDEKKFVTLSEG